MQYRGLMGDPSGGIANLMPPWKPGEAPNPNGQSKKSRRRKYLRDFINDRAVQPIGPERAQQLLDDFNIEDVSELEKALTELSENVTNGEMLAKEIWDSALEAKGGKAAEKARDQIIAVQPKKLEVDVDDQREPVVVPVTDERVTALAELAQETLH